MQAMRTGIQRGFENSLDRSRRELITERLTQRISNAPQYGRIHGPVQSVHLERRGEEISYIGHAVLADGVTVEVTSWSDGQNMQYDWRWPVR